MAFKGKTTSGYKSTTGKQLGRANTKGGIGGNPRGNKGLAASKSNIVTRAASKGVNPRNSRTLSLNANRVQRAGGPKTNPKQTGLGRTANQPAASSRGKQSMSRGAFGGYSRLNNSRAVPAGRGNIRNAGTVQRGDSARLQSASNFKVPKGALKGGGGFGRFVGQ